jgi:hypothetical protein
VRGFTEDEELVSIDLSLRRGVAEALDVGVQFVEKVISSHLVRHVKPFGPSTPMAQIRGAGSRSLTDTDLAWIDELLWLNGCKGVGLSLGDISVALRRERGVDFSAATLSRTFAQAAVTNKRAQPRHYYSRDRHDRRDRQDSRDRRAMESPASTAPAPVPLSPASPGKGDVLHEFAASA